MTLDEFLSIMDPFDQNKLWEDAFCKWVMDSGNDGYKYQDEWDELILEWFE